VDGEVVGSVLVGRERDLEVVTGMLDTVRERGRAHVITGEPGIGKTALLAAAVAEGERRGLWVLAARGAESEQHLHFAALHDLLRPLLAGVDTLAPGHRDALRSAFGLSVSTVSPELFFVALASLELIADAGARRPLFLVVDDLQWVDAASRDVIGFVARRLESVAVVLLIATRPEPAARVAAAGDPGVTRSVLTALDTRASRALLRVRAGEARDRVLAEAAGNPLALWELPITVQAPAVERPYSDIPPLTARLEQAFAARLPDLGSVPRLLVLLAAVNDGEALSEVIDAATIALGTSVSADEIGEVVDLALLQTDGVVLKFRHPLVRSAVWQSASDPARRAAHRALARALAGDPDRSAWHEAAAASGADEAVARILDQAAERALGRGAPSSAVSLLGRAAELSEEDGPRGRRLLRAAEVAFQLGRPDDVQRFMVRAQGLRLEATERGRLAFLQGAFDDGTPGDAEGVSRLIHSAAQARDDGEPQLAAELLIGASSRCWWGEPGQAVRDELIATADSLPLGGSDPRLLAAWAVGGKLARHRHVVERLNQWAEQQSVDPSDGALLGRAAFVCGEFERTLQFAQPAVDGLRQQGRLGLLAAFLVMRTFAAMYLGRWDLMETSADEARRLASESQQPVWEACAVLAQANLAGLRGFAERSTELLSVTERVAVLTGNEALINGVQASRGLRELGQGNPGGAFRHLRRTSDEDDHAFHPVQRFWVVDYLAEAAVGGGFVDEARTILRRMESVLGDAPGAGIHRAMRFARAVLAEDGDADSAFAEAFQLSRAASPWYRARLDLAYGTWLRRSRRASGSRGPLLSAHGVFEALGATAWAERAARGLRASGLKDQQTAARPATVPLSPLELQIARLAARGLTNREIGQQLFLSHRTVGSSLYRIFPKLAITSRAQLHVVLPPD